MTVVDLASLQLDPAVGGRGGQGTVYGVTGSPDVVFKRYHQTSKGFCADTLRLLVAERGRIFYRSSPVDEWAAWPQAVVEEAGQPVGFLMRRVSAAFTFRRGDKVRLSDLSFLAAKPSHLREQIPVPPPEVQVRILRDFASLMQALHNNKIVIGDVSFANVLWAQHPKPKVMLIDCDGMRVEGRPPVLPQGETVDWNDPLAPSGDEPDTDRDRYKLALAIVRVLTKQLDARPDAPLGAIPDGLTDGQREAVKILLQRALGPLGSRPAAKEWADALDDRDRQPVRTTGSGARAMSGPPPKPELLTSTEPRSFRPISPPPQP